jgi:hypothetical protein
MKTLLGIHLMMCAGVTGWFSTAAYNGWKTPSFAQQGQPGGQSSGHGYGYGHSYSSRPYYSHGTYGTGGRASGGSFGGGK